MAGSVKGLVIEIGGDTSGLQKALSKVNSSTASLSKELRGVNSLLKLDPSNTQMLSQKQEILKKNIEETSNKLEKLKEAQKEADKQIEAGTEISDENYRALQRDIVNTENKLKALKLEASNWTKAGKSIEEFGKKVENISNKLDKMGTTITTRLTLPIAAVAVGAVNSAKEFETAFTGVEKTVDGTKQQIENLKQGIKDMSEEIPSTTTEISAVAEAAGQLGIQTDNVLAFTKTMINMGNATNLTADEAATTLARFANVTKMSQSDFDKLGSVIVALGNNFATTESEITDMGMNLASAGTQVGMSQAQIMALATALSSVGLEAQAGGTAFSKVMVNMQLAVEKGGKELNNFASVAGMSSKAFRKAFKEDATSAIMKFVEGLSQSGERGKSAIKVLDDMGITETRLRDSLLRSANASEMFSKAIEVGNEAWNENTALADEANKRYQTLDSRIKTTTNKMNNLATNMGNKLTPTANKVLNKVDGLIDKLDGLTEEETENIIKTAAFVAAIGPAIKIVSKLGSTAGSVTKNIGTFAQVVGVLKNNSKSTNETVNNLAGIIKGLTSPLGLATTAFVVAAGAIVYFATKETEAQKEAKKLAEEVSNSKQKFDEYNSSVNSSITSNVAQINSTKDLKKELATLVDENGKVKQGYEGRAAYILNELNNALGTEYKMNGNIIQSYKDIQTEIDKTIEKKKAEVILQGEEEKYANWKKEESEATQQLYKATKQLNEVKEKYGMSLDELKVKAEGSYGKQKEYLDNVINTYEESVEKVREGEQIKKQYETDYALFVENKYDEMGKTIINTTSNWTSGTLDTLREGIKNQANELENWKTAYETAGGDVAKAQKEQAEKSLRDLAQNLADRTSTVKELGPDEYYAWKTLAEENYRVYSEQLDKMDPALKSKIENLTGYLQGDTSMPNGMEMLVKKTTSKFEEKMKVLTTDTKQSLKDIEKEIDGNVGIIYSTEGLIEKTGDTIKNDKTVKNSTILLAKDAESGFNDNVDGTKWGTDLSENISGGLTNQKSKSSITSAASKVGEWISWYLHHTTPDKGPLKDDDEWMPDFMENMENGILNNKKGLIKSIKKMSTEIKEAVNLQEIHDFGKLQGNLSNKVIDGTKTVFTTPQIVFNVQELDENRLEQCFNYVNKKFGSQY